MRASHDMPFGATLLAGGGARFRLWAPVNDRMELVLHRPGAEQVIAAERQHDGWRDVIVPDAPAGTRYQWRVHLPQGPLTVPDPASRSNPDGIDAPSVVTDPRAFEWADAAWPGRPWTEAICYELHVGTFTAEGSFDAARARLPDLAELGITCVQIMPLASAPGRFGWGYDGVLPFAPHPAYGPPESVKAFVQEAHRLGLMVMLDVVYNHFGPQGNYLPVYAPDFFTERHHTPWGAGINFDGRDARPVREFFIHNALYWLQEFRFDGLRFDAVHAMLDDSSPDIMEEISQRVRSAIGGRHIHLVLENDFNDARRLAPGAVPGRFDAQWSGDLHHALHVHLTGETEGYYHEYADRPLPMLAHALSHGFALEGAPHLADEAAQRVHPRRTAERPVHLSCALNFLQNHDQIGNRAFGDRLASLVDEAPLRLAAAVLILNPAPPMLFMGEEHGTTTPFLYFADWQGPLREAVAQGRRKEFERFAAFSDPAMRERIPDPCSPETFARCKLDWASFGQDAARRWRDFHRTLIDLRKRQIHPLLPSLTMQGHQADCSGHLVTASWRFETPAGPRWLEMQANLGDTAQIASPWEGEGTALYELGTCRGAELDAWSGRWRWNDSQPTSPHRPWPA